MVTPHLLRPDDISMIVDSGWKRKKIYAFTTMLYRVYYDLYSRCRLLLLAVDDISIPLSGVVLASEQDLAVS